MISETEVVFPIVYGSMAFSLGTKKTETSTHKWICYVRGVNNEDLSYLIRKVDFVLHSSFEDPVKSIRLMIQLYRILPSKSKEMDGVSSK